MILDKRDKNVWHDSAIDKITIEYNNIIIELETDAGIKKMILMNYIAFDYIGQWDENIVEAIYVESENDIIEKALKKINACNDTKNKGGGTRDIHSDWKCVIIKLIDSVCIKIVCDNVVYD